MRLFVLCILPLLLLGGCRRDAPLAGPPPVAPLADNAPYHSPDLLNRIYDAKTRAASDKLQRAGVISRGLSHCRRQAQSRITNGYDQAFAFSSYSEVCRKEFAMAECLAHEKPAQESAIRECTRRRLATLDQQLIAALDREQTKQLEQKRARDEYTRLTEARRNPSKNWMERMVDKVKAVATR